MKKYALIFLIVFAFTAGGCGGGGSSGGGQEESPAENSPPKVSAPFDSNGDGIPDVFGYYDANYSDGRNAPSNGMAYDVPYLNYIASSDTDEDGSFTASIYLMQGNEYVMKYSHSSRVLGENDIDFTILTPDDKELVFDYGLAQNTADEPAETEQQVESIIVTSDDAGVSPEENIVSTDTGKVREYVTVSASIDILPPENPCILFYTFTAPQTGIYAFTFREKEYSPTSQDVPYELRIYRSDDESALTLGNITLTPRKLLDVQRVLVSYADKFNADGLPVSFRPELKSEDVYTKILEEYAEEKAAASSLNAAAENGTAIKPVVYGVPYDADFLEGTGFYASSGLMALTESAFKDFVLPTPKTGADLPINVQFKTSEILTEDEHNREQELQDMSTFALCKNALGDRALTATNVRLAQISRNVVITYDVLEAQPRRVDVNDVQFSEEALELLKSDPDAFREDYGDYFVAGYTWGMRFRAIVSITCDNSNILDQVSSKIRTAASNAQSGRSYSSALQEVERLISWYGVNIDVEEMTIDEAGANKKQFDAAASLGTVAQALANFSEQVKTATKNDYVRLKVCFERFREIPAAKNYIPALLPITQSHFNAILEMNRTIFRTRCSYNALMSIPVNHLMNGTEKRHEWKQEFTDLVNLTKNQLNYICASESRTNDYRSRFQRLYDKYRALCERYVFYRRLVSAQNSQSRGFSDTDFNRDGSVGGGIYTYSQSSIVMGDYGSYADALHTDLHYSKDAKFLTYWMWTVTGDQSGTNWRYVWVRAGWTKTNNSDGKDRAYPTVGRKKLDWYFEGGTWRRAEWYLQNKIIYMNPNDYPFVGLKD